MHNLQSKVKENCLRTLQWLEKWYSAGSISQEIIEAMQYTQFARMCQSYLCCTFMFSQHM